MGHELDLPGISTGASIRPAGRLKFHLPFSRHVFSLLVENCPFREIQILDAEQPAIRSLLVFHEPLEPADMSLGPYLLKV